jgi:hypothetical protein
VSFSWSAAVSTIATPICVASGDEWQPTASVLSGPTAEQFEQPRSLAVTSRMRSSVSRGPKIRLIGMVRHVVAFV